MNRSSETSLAEQEREAWEASRRYIHGEIDVDDLEKVEASYVQHLKEATITSFNIHSMDSILRISLIFLTVIAMILGMILFISTQQQLLLILTSILSYPLSSLARFYFPTRKGKK